MILVDLHKIHISYIDSYGLIHCLPLTQNTSARKISRGVSYAKMAQAADKMSVSTNDKMSLAGDKMSLSTKISVNLLT